MESSQTSAKRRRLERQEYKRLWIQTKRAVSCEQSCDNTDNSDIVERSYNNGDDSDIHVIEPPTSPSESLHNSALSNATDSDNQAHSEDQDYWNLSDNEESHLVYISDTDESEDEVEATDIGSDLVSWANEHQIKHCAIDDLLKTINKNFNTNLPISARTLLKTERNVDIREKSGMQYVNLGCHEQLQVNLQQYPPELLNDIESFSLTLNVDGIPLFRSTNSSLWPVLCAINLQPRTVFPVVLTYGSSKPNNLEFLVDAIDELGDILRNGVSINGRLISVSLSCVVCDAPAKAMVKGVKLYSGYYGCDTCDQKGYFDGRLTYPVIEPLNLRTDQSFRQQVQKKHHNVISPFCRLPIDMIKSFPIDYMHQVCLGVTKKLLLMWCKGVPVKGKYRKREFTMSSQQLGVISSRLVNLRHDIPSVFARKPRRLNELDRWKATEFRQFLLYTGKIVMKEVLKPEYFHHFLALSVAISIMVSPSLAARHRQYAHDLLVYFVKEGRNLYGPEFLVYNVHSLLHLSGNLDNFNSLDDSSAFVFENYMQTLKKYVRSGKQPLVQICKRLKEMQNVKKSKKKKVAISTRYPNNVRFIGETEDVCEVMSVSGEVDGNGHKKVCRVYTRPDSLFKQPCDSKLFGAFKCEKRLASIRVVSNADLTRQAIMIKGDPEDRHATFLAILHDL